jgi:predicted RNase H-like HicB family nuclease
MHKTISFTGEIFKENGMFVAYCPELDLSSCGKDLPESKKNLLEATRLFMEEALKMGTLKEILEEAGYNTSEKELKSPLIETDQMKLEVEVGARA